MVVKNKEYQIKIDSINSQGAGVGRIEGMAVFVEGALPGEEVLALIIKCAKNYAVGKLLKVISPSPHRVVPKCAYYKGCGGCNLQHLAYDQQLELKLKETNETLRRISHLPIEIEAIVGADNPWFYRNKAQYPVQRGKDSTAQIGFFKRRSHNIENIDTCVIQQESTDVIACIREAIDKTRIPIYDETTHKGLLRHVVTRTATNGQMMLTLVINGTALPKQEEWINIIKNRLPNCVSLSLNFNTAKGNIILSDKCAAIWGKEYLEDEMQGIKYRLSPLSFLQVNSQQAKKLYQQVLDFANLKGDETVLDAYCGIGIMTLMLAKHAKKAIGIEIIPQAIEDAKENTRLNNITNAEFIAGDCAELLPKLFSNGLAPDLIVVDPPRAGCDGQTLSAIAQTGAKNLIYVSCDPATLARDLAILHQHSYTPTRTLCFDLFPQTMHVECVVLMSRVEK